MANEDSVLREVDQELAEDRQWQAFRKYGPAAIGAGLAIVVGVGAWQLYSGAKMKAAEKQATEFADAMETLAANPEDGRAALENIAGESDGGYAVLADFRRAASLAQAGETAEAEAIFVSIYDNNAAPKVIRDLARLRAAYLALDDGRDAVLGHLGHLTEQDGPYRPYADEATGVAALTAKDYETAHSIFTRLAADVGAPEAVAARAKEFAALSLSGKSGVNLTGEISLDDVLGAVGEVMDAGEVVPEEAGEGAAGQEGAEPQPEEEAGEDVVEDAAEADAESGNE